jgi:hypothetical protein
MPVFDEHAEVLAPSNNLLRRAPSPERHFLGERGHLPALCRRRTVEQNAAKVDVPRKSRNTPLNASQFVPSLRYPLIRHFGAGRELWMRP